MQFLVTKLPAGNFVTKRQRRFPRCQPTVGWFFALPTNRRFVDNGFKQHGNAKDQRVLSDSRK